MQAGPFLELQPEGAFRVRVEGDLSAVQHVLLPGVAGFGEDVAFEESFVHPLRVVVGAVGLGPAEHGGVGVVADVGEFVHKGDAEEVLDSEAGGCG